MRTAPAFTRAICAALLALLIAVRLLAPAGFMPAFDRGAVTIVACPDTEAGGGVRMSAHHEGHSKKLHQPCPYASASGLGSLAADYAPFLGVLILAAALLLGRTFLFLERSRAHERPPLRGPPLPA
jgi:hypothetical protein